MLTLAQHAKQKLTIDTCCLLDSAARALEEEYPVVVNPLNIKVITEDGVEI